MNKEESKKLIDKYLNGLCTPEEKSLVESFYQKESAKRRVMIDYIDFDETKAEIWTSIQRDISESKSSRFYSFRPLLAAASVILVLGCAFLFFKNWSSGDKAVGEVVKSEVNIAPANERAVLVLDDGTSIALNDLAKGTILSQAGNDIAKAGNGTIIYENNSSGFNKAQKASYNTLSTPRGGYYHLTLADGSNVWLNSASSIVYPSSFTGKERNVSITGEVYFEIAKDLERPFFVQAGDQKIRVLGTHFNVLSYGNESGTTTTLLEGSVKILKNNKEVVLKPGQAASSSFSTDAINVSSVDAEGAIAWKKGYFLFDNETLESIMDKIGRWYDVEIDFKSDIKEKRFWGTYSRSKSLDDLLTSLEQTEDVKFKIDGRRIVIMK